MRARGHGLWRKWFTRFSCQIDIYLSLAWNDFREKEDAGRTILEQDEVAEHSPRDPEAAVLQLSWALKSKSDGSMPHFCICRHSPLFILLPSHWSPFSLSYPTPLPYTYIMIASRGSVLAGSHPQTSTHPTKSSHGQFETPAVVRHQRAILSRAQRRNRHRGRPRPQRRRLHDMDV